MAERPPNRFQKNPRPNLEAMFERSDSEESRPRQGKRIRQPTARFVDEISPQLKAQYAAMNKRRIQRRNTRIEELKTQDRVRIARSSRQSESELGSQGNNGPTSSRLITSSSRMVEDGEQPNPDFSKVTSDPKSEGKHKRKKDKNRDR